MNAHSPEVLVVYSLDLLHDDLEVVGIYTHQDEAEAAQADAGDCSVVVPMSMAQALAIVRENAVAEQSHRFQHRLDQVTERLGQLTALITAQKVAA